MSEQEENAVTIRAAQALGISNLVPAVYEDLLRPSVRVVGERLVAVSKAVCIGLAPFEGIVWGYERIRDYIAASVAAKLASKPAEEIQPPDPTIAGPIFQRVPFTRDSSTLREMYTRLLARAMHTPSAPNVHPSFAIVVEQLSPADARLLHYISSKYNAGSTIQLEESRGEFLGSSSSIAAQWRKHCVKNDVLDTSVADAIYFNLVRLGFLIEREEHVRGDPRPADSREMMRGMGGIVQDVLGMSRSTILTSYGDQFLTACVRDLETSTTAK